MGTHYPKDTVFAFALQGSKGSANTTPGYYIPLIEGNIETTEIYLKDQVADARRESFRGAQIAGYDVAWSVKFYLRPCNVRLAEHALLAYLLGAEAAVTGGPAAPFTHTFTPVAAGTSLKWLTLFLDRGVEASPCEMWVDAKPNSVTIEANQREQVVCTIEGFAISKGADQSALSATYNANSPYVFKNMKFYTEAYSDGTEATAADTKVRRAVLTITNNHSVEAEQADQAGTISGITEGDIMATLEFDKPFDSATDYDAYTGDTAQTLKMEFESVDVDDEIYFAIPKMAYTTAAIPGAGLDRLTGVYTITAEAEYDKSNDLITAVAHDSESGKYIS
tara:strand:+ start:1629 stop:2636 length:1008 start_codon:yes stop_codon:yes gene_type:complete